MRSTHLPKLWLSLIVGVFAVFSLVLIADKLGLVASDTHYRMSDRLSRVVIQQDDSGEKWVIYQRGDHQTRMTPQAFVDDLYNRKQGNNTQSFLFRLFDITSGYGLFWIAAGLGAQIIFTARMLVQWLASERAQASVVPEAFWWLSLLGASMLLMYFLWRGDLVGILGQATGWVVYLRNLWFIHQPPGENTNRKVGTAHQKHGHASDKQTTPAP